MELSGKENEMRTHNTGNSFMSSCNSIRGSNDTKLPCYFKGSEVISHGKKKTFPLYSTCMMSLDKWIHPIDVLLFIILTRSSRKTGTAGELLLFCNKEDKKWLKRLMGSDRRKACCQHRKTRTNIFAQTVFWTHDPYCVGGLRQRGYKIRM
jgi:hypothetical protein